MVPTIRSAPRASAGPPSSSPSPFATLEDPSLPALNLIFYSFLCAPVVLPFVFLTVIYFLTYFSLIAFDSSSPLYFVPQLNALTIGSFIFVYCVLAFFFAARLNLGPFKRLPAEKPIKKVK